MSTINTHFCITVMKKGTMLFKVSTIHFSQCMYLRKFVPILFKIRNQFQINFQWIRNRTVQAPCYFLLNWFPSTTKQGLPSIFSIWLTHYFHKMIIVAWSYQRRRKESPIQRRKTGKNCTKQKNWNEKSKKKIDRTMRWFHN